MIAINLDTSSDNSSSDSDNNTSDSACTSQISTSEEIDYDSPEYKGPPKSLLKWYGYLSDEYKDKDSSNSSHDRKGPSKASIPKFEGPSVQGLLDWYGYNTIKAYLSWKYFPSTDKDVTDKYVTNKDSTDEDCIHESNSVMSKGKYVSVLQKHNPKVKSLVPVTGCVLGLANVYTWNDILKKFRVRKPESCADKAKEKRKWKKPTSTISDQTIANFKTQLDENEVVRVMIPKCMSWLDAYDEPIGDMEYKVDNSSPQSTPQVLPSFEVFTPPVTYLEEIEETIGVPMEVEPLHEPQLEDLYLNTCNHDIPLSSREVSSFNEPKPQRQPLPNCPPLDVNLGDKRGTDPPIKPHSSDSFRMKIVDKSTINTPPSHHVASFHLKDIFCYYHPCVDDPKKLWI
nr:hypothetical protein [Tanacetum cinerariifolium]